MSLLNDSAVDFLNLVKQATLSGVENSKPVSVIYGTVVSESPLRIKVDQKLILSMAQLKLSRNVTNYDVEMEVEHMTESSSGGSGDSSFASHSHGYDGKKVFRVNNALRLGEIVSLIREQGGQKFLVIDRVGE